MKISQVLHKAADKHLAYDYESYIHPSFDKERFSCCAVSIAIENNPDLYYRIMEGLTEMGCPTGSIYAFTNMGYEDELDKNTQGARYIWLKFAALMAEEQGV
jgi:hypothetical protein